MIVQRPGAGSTTWLAAPASVVVTGLTVVPPTMSWLLACPTASPLGEMSISV